jgi:TolB-like protein
MGVDFRLGEWIIRPQRDCIECGAGVIHVKPKAMAVLEHLARAAGDVVSREELFVSIWQDGVVTDDVLTQCIVELRKAFGDSARRPQVIETIPRIGFRLVPAVIPLCTDSGAPGDVAGNAKSIAVLAFVDMSAQRDQGYFADGLSEELINRLAQLRGLEVTSRTSSFYFKSRNEELQDIAEALGVNHLLEGSVRRDKNRLRITAQLIEVKTGFHLWSRQFDRPFEEFFAIQDEITESIATALSIKLQVGELGTIPGGTSSVKAHEELLLSKRDQWESTPESILRAIDHVKRAIGIDPGYALAWWRLAGLYINAGSLLGTERLPDAFLLSEHALARAKSLEPALPGVKFMTALIQNKKQQWSEVENTLNRGAGLDRSSDGDLILVYCGFLLRVGRIRAAIPLLERVRRLMPFNSRTARALGSAYVIRGRIEEGFAEVERAFEIEGFESLDVANGMTTALSTGDRDVLLKWLARAEQYMPESRSLVTAMTESLDDRETALAWLRKTFQQTEKQDQLIASWAAWHGDTGLALDALRRYPAPMGFWKPVMKEVRRTPGFKDLVRQVGLEEYYREYGWNDFCCPVGLEDFECE